MRPVTMHETLKLIEASTSRHHAVHIMQKAFCLATTTTQTAIALASATSTAHIKTTSTKWDLRPI